MITDKPWTPNARQREIARQEAENALMEIHREEQEEARIEELRKALDNMKEAKQ